MLGVATPSSAAVTPATVTVSPAQGPSTGGNTVTIAATGGATPFFPGVDVEFQVAATATSTCAATYAAPVTPTSTAGGILDFPGNFFISSSRLAVNVQSFGTAPLTSKYNVCVYSAPNSTGVLLGQTATTGQYAIGTRVMLNNVWPPAGAAQGGTTITVNGANFPTTISSTSPLSATLGGLQLANITPVSASSFTAVTPPHAPSVTPVPLIVTTASGTTILGKAFTYENGITVTPATGSNNFGKGNAAVDITGIGFGGLNFTMPTSPDDQNSHVYLVRGVYDPSLSNSKKGNGEILECTNPMVVSDTELVCTMNLQTSLTAAGANVMPTRTVSATTSSDINLTNISPPLFQKDVGDRVAGAGIAPTTTIATVSPTGTSATLSVATTAGASNVTVAVGAGTATANINAPAPNSPPPTALTGISPPLSNSDWGRVVTGPGIPAGDTITGINQDGSASLALTPTSSTPTATITISDGVPVPTGTYTMTIVSNGSIGAQATDPNYTVSVVSSGSTYTVSDF